MLSAKIPEWIFRLFHVFEVFDKKWCKMDSGKCPATPLFTSCSLAAGELLDGFWSKHTITIPESGMQMTTVAHFVSTKSGIVIVELEAWRLRANMAFRVHKTIIFSGDLGL